MMWKKRRDGSLFQSLLITHHSLLNMYDRLMSSLVALSLAVLIWLYARSRNVETLDSVPIPVQISLAADQASDYEMEMTGASQVPVSFMGTPSRLRGL